MAKLAKGFNWASFIFGFIWGVAVLILIVNVSESSSLGDICKRQYGEQSEYVSLTDGQLTCSVPPEPTVESTEVFVKIVRER